MITGKKASLYARFAETAYGKTDIPEGYDKTPVKKFSDLNTGFKAAIYKKTGTSEYIVAFTGTEDAQDAVADTALGKEQWENNRSEVLARLLELNADKITFTGHSLGGGLAQYATYDFLEATPISAAPVVDLVTFAGLGGESGLKQMHKTDYDSAVADRIHEVAHYIGCSDGFKYGTNSGYVDLVSRIGDGHLGGNTILTKFLDGLGVMGTHCGFPYWTDPAFMSSSAVFTADIDYLDIPGAQKIAAAIAYTNHDGVITDKEAVYRLVGSALFALSEAPTEEIDQLYEALPWDTLPGESIESLCPVIFDLTNDPDTIWDWLFKDTIVEGELTTEIRSFTKLAMRFAGSISNSISDSSQATGELNLKVIDAFIDASRFIVKSVQYALKEGSSNMHKSFSMTQLILFQQINRIMSTLLPGVIDSFFDTPVNEKIFNLSVDPTLDNATDNGRLGSTSNGDGLLDAGAGYTATMPDEFVNQGGLSNTAASGFVPDFTRPGNHSDAEVDDVMNALRKSVDSWQQFETGMAGDLTAAGSVEGTAYQVRMVLTPTAVGADGKTYEGNSFEAMVNFSKEGIAIGITALTGQAITVTDGSTGMVIMNETLEAGSSYVPKGTTESGDDIYLTGTLSLADKSGDVFLAREGADRLSYIDPVSFDAGSDGIRYSATSVPFDLDGDGVAEQLPWVASTDPFLVMDLDGDGKISSGRELVEITDTGVCIDLYGLDENNDLVLDENDSAYWQLQLWGDRNLDGYAGSGELQSLKEAGIKSIDLDPDHEKTDAINGSVVKGVDATCEDGSTKTLWDLPLTNTGTAVTTNTTEYSDGINKITGLGETALTATSTLGVKIRLDGSGAGQAIGNIGDDTLTGTAGDDWLIGGSGSDRFQGGAGRDLLVIDADDLQSGIDAGSDIDTVLVADDAGVIFNLARSHVEVVYGGYGDDVFIGGGADNYFIGGAAGDDLIMGGSADDVLHGEDGDDVVGGNGGNDLIRGHRGADMLYGGDGNDVLDGGLGNDMVAGEKGNDVILASGGEDYVDGGAGIDMLNLSGGLEDYRIEKNDDGSYTITDTRNNDGSTVADGEVSDRDGIQHLSNVERFSFIRGNNTPTAFSFDSDAVLSVNDALKRDAALTSYTISIDELLDNDLDFNGKGLCVAWVGDAVGGTVSLSGTTITFTRDESYQGALEFAYKLEDAPDVVSTGDATVKGEMKSRVLLVPEDGPEDPDYARQWYLGAVGAPSVWDDYTGKGIKVLVLEPSGRFAVSSQAADLNHEDLIDNKSGDFKDTAVHSVHATAVAGVIGAARNGKGSVGVAYDVTLDSIGFSNGAQKMASDWRSDMEAMQDYDVVNNSWEYSDPWGQMGQTGWAPLEYAINMEAINQAATRGRDGLGSILVYAAGNDREKGYDAGLSTLTANPYTITVGAVNRTSDVGSSLGINQPFSNRGANILVSAPGSNILTTSVRIENANGSVFGSDSTETSGTSVAAPIVSGVAALMLDANPGLSYRDVQTILALTAKKDFGDGTQAATDWNTNGYTGWNGVGMHYSHDYGFGMVDALGAVRMAETWVSEGNDPKTAVANAGTSAVPDQGSRTLTFEVDDDVDVAQVIVNLQLDHPRWSDLRITLISPSGTSSILLDRTGVVNGTANLINPLGELHFDKDLMSVHFRGEESAGTWKLVVEDQARGMAATGSIIASLEIVGTDTEQIKRYVITDEYDGGRNLGADPGTFSELNGAAVSGTMFIDLSAAQTSRVNGKSLFLSTGIDRLVAGDGNDTLLGGTGNESILGARGDDSILGGTGNDTLGGGRGNDILKGGTGIDSLAGGAGNDTLFGNAGQDLLVADQGADTLWGGADADVFLIDGDTTGTCVIKDFSLAGNDTLQIRTRTKVDFSTITQEVRSGSLHVSYATAEGSRTVILEGITDKLDAKRLRTLNAGQEVSVDPVSGGFVGHNVVVVKPEWELVKVYPSFRCSAFMGTEFPSRQGFLAVDSPGIKIAHISEHSVECKPGQRIAIVFDSAEQRSITDPDSQSSQTKTGYTRYVLLEPSILKAKWLGTDRTHTQVLYMVANYYSNNGQVTYRVKDMHWVQGTDESETLIAGDISEAIRNWPPFKALGKRKFYAKGGDDKLIGNDEDEELYGESGFDTLIGGGGDDLLYGDSGTDLFIFASGAGEDTIDDLEDTDTLEFEGIGSGDVVRTTTFENKTKEWFIVHTRLSYDGGLLYFDSAHDYDQAAIGSITLYNAQFSDTSRSVLLDGKTITNGADLILQKHYGQDTINTLAGDDLIFSLTCNNQTINAGQGQDTVYALEGGNFIDGSTGDDKLEVTAWESAATADTLVGGAGNDILTAGDHGALVYGDDQANSLDGVDTLIGGQGNDTLYGAGGDDSIEGNGGNDEIHGGQGFDAIDAGAGDDTVYGGAGNDVITSGKGDDTLVGGAGDDVFETGSGHDSIVLNTASGHDTASTLTGQDTVTINGINSIRGFELLDNGARVKLSWSGGSLTLSSYNFGTKFKFGGDNSECTLTDIFNKFGYYPDDSFNYLGMYDTQLEGDPDKIGTIVGDGDGDQLYGGPLSGTETEDPAVNGVRYGDDDAAYWYVLGRQGDDSLAGGKSGAYLDGGAGNDKLRGSNGVSIIRDTFHGGQDTLVMPEGATPGTLRFFRIPNPLEAAMFKNGSLDPDGYGATASPIGIEDVTPNSQLPVAGINKRFDIRYLDSDSNDNTMYQHCDTLRIQSIDGKNTVDIIGYFETGVYKNDIASILFPTVFDDQGHSVTFNLEDLAGDNVQGGEYSFTDDGIRTDIANVEGADYNPADDGHLIVGGENGTHLKGKVKVTVNWEYEDWYGDMVSASRNTVVSDTEYREYKSSYEHHNETVKRKHNGDWINVGLDHSFSSRDLDIINQGHIRILNGLSIYYDETPPDEFDVTAIALPDRIIGYGGNDTIEAGGVYVETHYSGRPIYPDRWDKYQALSNATDFSRYHDGYLYDEVNGGAGDDTYVYNYGDGNLHIIDIDSPFAGANGFDILQLNGFEYDEVDIDIDDDGSFVIELPDRNDSKIEVAAGADGCHQVDRIIFNDRSINIQDLPEIIAISAREYTAADGRTFSKNKLALAPADSSGFGGSDNYGVNTEGLELREGTPVNDAILVNQNQVVLGYEGADQYIVDMQNVDFSVIAMDRGDSVIMVMGGDTESSALENYISGFFSFFTKFAGAQSEDGTYLGKSQTEWVDSGIFPFFGNFIINEEWMFNLISNLNDVSNTTIQLGTLGTNASSSDGYALSDWCPVGETNETASDMLLQWQSVDDGGKALDQCLVLTGIADTWGNFLIDGLDTCELQARYLNGVYGTQGNDYFTIYNDDNYNQGDYEDFLEVHIANLSDYNDLLEGYSKVQRTYALAGNDTVAAYATDKYLIKDNDGDEDTEDLEFYAYDNMPARSYVGAADFIQGGSGSDLMDGGAGADSLYGGSGDDTLTGGFGNDYLQGGPGADTLEGGQGNDIYEIDADDTIIEGDGYKAYNVPEWIDGEVVYRPTLFLDSGVDEVRGELDIDLAAAAFANIENATLLGTTAHTLNGNGGANILTGNNAGSTLAGGGGDDVYILGGGADMIIEAAGAGRDRLEISEDATGLAANVEDLYSRGMGLSLYGNRLDNYIKGDSGSNIIDASFGTDTMAGGAGDDIYYVDNSNDVVIEAAGNGHDMVYAACDYSLKDSVKIIPDDIVLTRDGMDLVITIRNSADALRLQNWGAAEECRNYRIEFTDGSVWTEENIQADIMLHNREISGTYADDTLQGWNDMDDILKGLNGYDVLYGGGGSDTLDGGTGNDTLYGGLGNDTYQFSIGDESDTIYDYDTTAGNLDAILFGEGISYEDLIFSCNERDLIINITGHSDQVTVKNWLDGSYHRIERFLFTSGGTTSWNTDALNAWLITQDPDAVIGTGSPDTIKGSAANDFLYGGTGGDILYGGGGDDKLDGGSGNDSLNGGTGNDTYIFGRGYGRDTIYENSDNYSDPYIDTIQFGSGITSQDLIFTCSENDLVIGLKNNALDQLAVKNWGDDKEYQIEQLVFHDGGSIDLDAVNARIENNFVFTGNAENDTIYGWAGADNVLNGLGGDDTLRGDYRDDILDGGAGDDRLSGGDGNDTYLFGLDYGKDNIWESNSSNGGALDLIQFGAGITAEDLIFTRSGDNLVIGIKNNSLDQLTIMRWGYDRAYQIEQLNFHNGETMDSSAINAQIDWAGTNNTLYGTEERDTLIGQTGDDTLNGGKGNDYLRGASGNDTYVFCSGDGSDTINDSDGSLDAIHFGAEISPDDISFSRSGMDLVLNMGDGQIVIWDWGVGSAYFIERFIFNETQWDLDKINEEIAYLLTDVVVGDAYDNKTNGWYKDESIPGTNKHDYLSGGGGNDSLNGRGGNDELSGGDGDDFLDGGAGNDVLRGGGGNDTYYFNIGSGNDSVYDENTSSGESDTFIMLGDGITQSNLVFQFGSGCLTLTVDDDADDHLVIKEWSIESRIIFQFSNGAALHNELLWGKNGIYNFSLGDGKNAIVDNNISGNSVTTIQLGYNDGIEEIRAVSQFGVHLTGNDLDNRIAGNTGDDTLDGGFGVDNMYGGAGDDTYIVDNLNDIVGENPGEGIDTIKTGLDYILGGNVEHLILTGTGMIDGTGNALDNQITGNNAANNLAGGAGNDTLNGGQGIDTLEGGYGDDTYLVDNPADVVVENEDQGHDIIVSSIDFDLGSLYVEDLTLSGTAASGKGNDSDNKIIGNTADNSLKGLAGNDTLRGKNGKDRLYGGTGNDSLTGDEGDDYLSGGDGDDTLLGGAGDDTLSGGRGSDYMAGGTDDDYYRVTQDHDIVFENEGEGTDSIHYSGKSDTFTLPDYVENLSVSYSITLIGNNWDNEIQASMWKDNILDGKGGDDTLNGLYGDDTYIYRKTDGKDTIIDKYCTIYREIWDGDDHSTIETRHPEMNIIKMIDGIDKNNPVLVRQDNDLYIFVDEDNYIRVADQFLSGGTTFYGVDALVIGDEWSLTRQDFDIITTDMGAVNDNAGLSLTEKFEAMKNSSEYSDILADSWHDGVPEKSWLSGTSVTESLIGTGGGDYIIGGGGADTLIGGKGNDTYFAYDNCTIKEEVNEGIDTLLCYFGSLPDNVENGIMIGYSENNLSGNKLDNHLTGNNADNTLSGGLGNDTLKGNGGADTLIGGKGNDLFVEVDSTDVITEESDEGIDTVETFCTHELAANVENLTLTGYSAANGTGNNLGNTIIGNRSANTIDGGAGDDLLQGGEGSDTYLFGKTDGKDTITDFYETAEPDSNTVKMTEDFEDGPVFVKDDNDLYLFVDSDNYIRVTDQFQTGDPDRVYGVDRLEITNGSYVSRQDIEAIVNTMSGINNDGGMDYMQKFNAIKENETYLAALGEAWRQA